MMVQCFQGMHADECNNLKVWIMMIQHCGCWMWKLVINPKGTITFLFVTFRRYLYWKVHVWGVSSRYMMMMTDVDDVLNRKETITFNAYFNDVCGLRLTMMVLTMKALLMLWILYCFLFRKMLLESMTVKLWQCLGIRALCIMKTRIMYRTSQWH